jgi:hypothetical protein
MKEHEHCRGILLWIPAILIALLGAVLMMAISAPLKGQSSLNLVYVESNIGSTPNSNSVFGFTNSGGVLTPITGSPWLTGGTGVYDPGQAKGITEFDADQQVIITPQNNVLYAVNGDSNTFAAFAINTSTGALTALPGSPYKSNGSDPVSFGFLYNILASGTESWLGVVNKGADPNQTDQVPNVSGFKIDSAGVPILVSQSVFEMTAGSSPSQLLAVTGSLAQQKFWAYLDLYQGAGPRIPGVYALQILGTAGLKRIHFAGPKGDPPPLGIALNPASRVFYTGFPTLNEVGIFFYDTSTGNATYNSAVPNPGTGVGWLTVGPPGTGHFLYASEPGSGTITVYSITFDGTSLTQVQHFALSGTGPTPGNIAFDPTGAYLYCLDNVHAMLHVLNVDSTTGNLSEPNSPTALSVPTGEEPLGIATAQF